MGWNEMNNGAEEVKSYLKKEFADLLEEEYLYEWISAHLEYNEQKIADYIIGGLGFFCAWEFNGRLHLNKMLFYSHWN